MVGASPGARDARGRGGAAVIAVLGVDGGRAAGRERRAARATRRSWPAAGATRRAGARRRPAGGAHRRRSSPALDALAAHDGAACVLASGDPGFFGIVRALARARGGRPARRASRAVVGGRRVRAPGPRVGRRADGQRRTRRDPRRRAARRRCAIPRSRSSPRRPRPGLVRARLAGSGRRLAVAERLGQADERVCAGTPRSSRGPTFAEPNVVIASTPDARRQRARPVVVAAAQAGAMGTARRRLRPPGRDGDQGRGARAGAGAAGSGHGDLCGTSGAAAAR